MVFALPPALSPAPHPCLQEHQPDAKLGLQTRPPALYFFQTLLTTWHHGKLTFPHVMWFCMAASD